MKVLGPGLFSFPEVRSIWADVAAARGAIPATDLNVEYLEVTPDQILEEIDDPGPDLVEG